MVFIPRWERYRDKKPSGAVEIDWSHELSNGLVFAGVPDVGVETPVGTGLQGLITTDNTYRGTILGSTITVLEYVFDVPAWNSSSESYKDSNNEWPNSEGILMMSPKSYGQVVFRAVKDSNSYIEASADLYDGNLSSDSSFIRTASLTQDKQVLMYSEGSDPASVDWSGYAFKDVTGGNIAYGVSLDNSANILSLRHDRVLLADEVKSLHEAPYQILKPRRRWFVFGSGTSGLTVIINSAGEVVSANQLTGAKLLNLSNSAETSLAQQTGAAKTASISNSAENSVTSAQRSEKAALSGTSPETDTAFSTFTLKEFTLNYSAEVDSSNIFSFASTSGITTATSAELASNVTTTKTLNVLPGTSAVSAGNFISDKVLQLPISTETTTANAFTYSQLSGITTAAESSMALGFSFAGTVMLGKALESAFAKTITASKVALTNLAAETSLPNQLTTAKSLTLTLASELNTAASFLYSSITGIGTAFSTETATSVLGTIYATLYPSLENNIVLGITSETVSWDFAVKTLKIIKTSRKVTIN